MAQHGLVSALLFFFPCCAGEPPRAKNWRASAGQKRASLPGLKAGDLFPPTLVPLRGRSPPLPARGGSFSSLRGEKVRCGHVLRLDEGDCPNQGGGSVVCCTAAKRCGLLLRAQLGQVPALGDGRAP